MVLFIVFADAMAGEARTGGETVAFFARLSLGGVALGGTAGWLTVKALQSLHFDIVAQIATTVFAAYGTFVLAEATPVHVSGVLAVVALGLAMSSGGRTAVHAHETLHEFWEMVEYLANTIVFVLSGAVIMERGFNSEFITGVDWLYLLLLYAVLNVVRLFTLVLLWPILRNLGYGITLNEIFVVAWSGLRGAVGLVLALLVAEGDQQKPEDGARFLFYMAGIAVLTLVVNGTTTGTLLKYMGLVSRTQASELMFATALHHIEHHTLSKHKELRADNTYTSVDWAAVEAFMGKVFDNLYEELHALQEHHKFVQAAKEGGAAHFVRTHCSRMACCPKACPCCASCVPRARDGVTPASPALKSQVALHLSPRKTASAAPSSPNMDALDLGAGAAPSGPRVNSIRIPRSGTTAATAPGAFATEGNKPQTVVSLPVAARHSGALHVELSTIDEATSRSNRGLGAATPMLASTLSADSTPLATFSPGMDSVNTSLPGTSRVDDGMCGAARVHRSEAAGRRRHRNSRKRKSRTAKRQGSAKVRNSIADVHAFSSQHDLTPPLPKEPATPAKSAGKSDGYATDNEDSDGDSAISELTATSEESIYTESSRSDLNSDSSVGDTDGEGDEGESDASIAGSVSSMKGRLQEATAVQHHQQQLQQQQQQQRQQPEAAVGDAKAAPRVATPQSAQGRSLSEMSMQSDDSSRMPVRLDGRPPLVPLRPTINVTPGQSARSVTFDAKRGDTPGGLRQRSLSMQGSGRDSPTTGTPRAGSDMSELRSYGHHEDFRADTLRRRSTAQGSDAELRREMVREARYRFFNLLKAEYWVLFETGMVGQAAVTQLQEAASSCQDVPEGPLCDFDIVQRLIHANPLRDAFKYLCKCLPSLSQWWLLESLYFEFDLVFGFIEGHKAVHHIFPKVMRNRGVARKLIKESQQQVQHGLRYMAEVEQTLPELAGAVKTKHVMRALIHDIGNVAKRLLHHGEIEQREYQGITEKVYTAWKNVKITSKAPSEADLLRNVGYLADLDDALFDDLYKHSQRRVFQDGEAIMAQGEKSHGFLIIVRGSVDITRRMKVGTSSGTPKTGNGHKYSASTDAAGRFELGAVAAAGPGMGPRRSSMDHSRAGARPGRLNRGATVTGYSAEAMARSALEAHAAEEGTISASRMDSHSSTGSGRRAFLTRFKSGAIPEQFETRAVDRVSSGAVVGLLAMLTGQRTLVASTACGPVVAVHFSAVDIFRLLKSKANPDLSVPRRIAAPLEEVLCRMAAVIVAEALLEAELGVALKPAQIRQIIQDTEFVRPEPKRPICIPYRAILLTGAELKPRNRRTALLADRLYVERQRTLNPALRAAQRAKRQHSARMRVLSAEPNLGAGAAAAGAQMPISAARTTSASAQPFSGDAGVIQAGKSLSDPDVWSARARLSRTGDIPDAAACVGIMDEIDELEDSDSAFSSDAAEEDNIYAGESVGDDGGDGGIQAPKAQSGSFMGSFMDTLRGTIGLEGSQPADTADDAYDPNYHAKYSSASKGLHELQDAEFVVVRRAFSFLDLPAKRKDGDQAWRWFSKGTRLLLLPDKHARVFSSQHAALLAEVATKQQLRHVGQSAQARLRPSAAAATSAGPVPVLKKAAPAPLTTLSGAGDAEFVIHSGAPAGADAMRPPPASGIRGVVTPIAAPPTTASAKAFWQSRSRSSPMSAGSAASQVEAVPHGLIGLGAAPTDDQLHTVDMASHDGMLWQAAFSTGAAHISPVLWRRRSALEGASKRWWQVQGQGDREFARVAVYAGTHGGDLLAPIFVNAAQASTLAHHKMVKSPLAAAAAAAAGAGAGGTLVSKSLPPAVHGHTAQLPHPSADLSRALDPHSAADAHAYLLGVMPPRRSLRQRSKAVSAWRSAAMREAPRGSSLRDAWAHAQCAAICRTRARNGDWRVELPARPKRGRRRALRRSMSASRLGAAAGDSADLVCGFTSDTNDTAAALSAEAVYRSRPKAFRGPACTAAYSAPSSAMLAEFIVGPAPTGGSAARRSLPGAAVNTANAVQRSAMLQHNSRISSADSLPSLVGDAEVYDASVHVAPTYSAIDASAMQGGDDTISMSSAASSDMLQQPTIMRPQQQSGSVVSLSSVGTRGATDMPSSRLGAPAEHVPGGVSDRLSRRKQ